MIDFATLERPDSPNTYLVCDADVCAAEADRSAPRYPQSPEAVRDALLEVVRRQPRITEGPADPQTLTYSFVQRSFVFRFADDVTFRIAPQADAEGARVFAYSASRVGRSDFGVNKKRVDGWLEELEAALAATP